MFPHKQLFTLLDSGLPRRDSSKESACQCKRHKRCRFDPWVGKILWRRKCIPLQYSCLENSMDRRSWQAAFHGVTKSQTRLSGPSTEHSTRLSSAQYLFGLNNINMDHCLKVISLDKETDGRWGQTGQRTGASFHHKSQHRK